MNKVKTENNQRLNKSMTNLKYSSGDFTKNVPSMTGTNGKCKVPSVTLNSFLGKFSAGIFRRHLRMAASDFVTSQPNNLASSKDRRRPSFRLTVAQSAWGPALCKIARWNRPRPKEDTISKPMLAAPELSPKRVTLWALPPNLCMFRWTHSNDMRTSIIPAFPGECGGPSTK